MLLLRDHHKKQKLFCSNFILSVVDNLKYGNLEYYNVVDYNGNLNDWKIATFG